MFEACCIAAHDERATGWWACQTNRGFSKGTHRIHPNPRPFHTMSWTAPDSKQRELVHRNTSNRQPPPERRHVPSRRHVKPLPLRIIPGAQRLELGALRRPRGHVELNVGRLGCAQVVAERRQAQPGGHVPAPPLLVESAAQRLDLRLALWGTLGACFGEFRALWG